MSVFTERDRIQRVVMIDESGNRYPVHAQYPVELTPHLDDEQVEISYSASGSVICDRLDLMGFTLEATRKFFDTSIADQVEELKARVEESEGDAHLYGDEFRVLSQLTFHDWLTSFRSLVERNIHSWDLRPWTSTSAPPNISPLETYMLEDDPEYHHFGFPVSDVRYFLRAAVEACGRNALVEQDLTGVVHAGYYDLTQQVAEKAREELLVDFPANARVVVITEGVTDRRALEAALGLLYPHLVEYFAFMDFEGAGVAGGAGPLVATLKAFAGAGIANRIIGVFDNDTAAHVALRGLGRVRLPSNIKTLTYPRLPLADRYPTIGPGGLAEADVNGLAGSLELYFGEDVLRRGDGTLTPIQWKGYESTVQQYQGELMGKALLQRVFAKKVESAKADSTLLESQDWSGMKAILDSLRRAFNDEPRSTIRSVTARAGG